MSANMSNRVKTLTLAGAALALAVTQASAQTKWNLPSAYPQDNPHVENLNLFAKDVAEATGGKLQIAVHPGASLSRPARRRPARS
jgi:TRAP-type C4-dicarboxylate transport system substrate-binding protein